MNTVQLLGEINILFNRKNNIKNLLDLIGNGNVGHQTNKSTTQSIKIPQNNNVELINKDVNLIGIKYDASNNYTDFKSYFNNIQVLIVYNENFGEFLDKNNYGEGSGNGFMRKYRSDSMNINSGVINAFSLGIPTGTIYGNDGINGKYNNTQTSYKEIIDLSMEGIINFINKNPIIKYVLWAIDNEGILGLDTFNTTESQKIVGYISNKFKSYFKNQSYYPKNTVIKNHGNYGNIEGLSIKMVSHMGIKLNLNTHLVFDNDTISVAIMYNFDTKQLNMFNNIHETLTMRKITTNTFGTLSYDPHITLFIILFNKNHLDTKLYIEEVKNGKITKYSLTSSFETKIYEIYNLNIENKIELKRNLFGKFGEFCALEYEQINRDIITDFRTGIYKYIYPKKLDLIKIRRLNKTNKNIINNYYVFCKDNKPFYAIPDHSYGKGHWKPHVSIAKIIEIDSEMANIYNLNNNGTISLGMDKFINDKKLELTDEITLSNPKLSINSYLIK